MDPSETRLTLRSRLDQLEVVWPWVDALAGEHSIPANSAFAIHLCLEEAISNIIRHGYGDASDGQITVEFAISANTARFVVEDHAAHFNPLIAPDAGIPVSLDDVQAGGRGIHLLRQFASDVEYEALASGNRLTFSFLLP